MRKHPLDYRGIQTPARGSNGLGIVAVACSFATIGLDLIWLFCVFEKFAIARHIGWTGVRTVAMTAGNTSIVTITASFIVGTICVFARGGSKALGLTAIAISGHWLLLTLLAWGLIPQL